MHRYVPPSARVREAENIPRALDEAFWHSRPLSAVLDRLGASNAGLSSGEAADRLSRYGRNVLPSGKTDSLFTIFLRQFKSPLIYVLFAAAFIVAILGERTDALVIFAVLFFNAVVGAFQEGRAQNTLKALRSFATTRATVLRDGKEIIIPDGDLVPGDVISLQEGEKIPADARLLSVTGFKTNEASLTGESEPVAKDALTLSNQTLSIPDRRNMVFKGTYAVSGSSTAIVTATGLHTAVGRIASEIQSIDEEIPLQRDIRGLSRLIIAMVALVGALIFTVGLARGVSMPDLFITIVALSVSIIPEGLPVVLTLVLASGVWRMGKRNALVKRLQAVEALGQTKVIAVDKTGTLTKNEMVIERVAIGGAVYTISGNGYESRGEASQGGHPVDPPMHEDLLLAGKIASFCASARVSFDEREKVWRVSGDPTEASMLVFGQKMGFDQRLLFAESPTVFELPFDSSRKYHLMMHLLRGKRFMTVVGAPETVMPLCARLYNRDKTVPMTAALRESSEAAVTRLADGGFRVLAFAMHGSAPAVVSADSLPTLSLVGFFGMRDPLRPEVPESMRIVREAQMRVIMLTGDHKLTAEAIAREAGIAKHGEKALSGEDIDKLTDEELAVRVGETNVYARVTPEHKLRIIRAFKKRGEIIAMTGDGVNDAPSLVAADLGVAMGKIGTEVTKEAADIVLLDDNFASIVAAAEEGRSIYRTVKKVILYLFSTSLAEVGVIGGAIALGFALPLLPTQIIWLNFVTDGFLTVALAMEPKEEKLLGSAFKRPNRFFVDRLMALRMGIMALVMSVGTLVLFAGARADMAKALTVSLTVLAVFQWFNAWNCRHERDSVFGKSAVSNLWLASATGIVVVLQLIAVYHPTFQKLLHTVPLSLYDWMIIVGVAGTIIVAEEGRKWLVRKADRKEPGDVSAPPSVSQASTRM